MQFQTIAKLIMSGKIRKEGATILRPLFDITPTTFDKMSTQDVPTQTTIDKTHPITDKTQT